MSNLRLAPISEVILKKHQFLGLGKITKSIWCIPLKRYLYESVSAGTKYQGVEHWLPFFHDKLETIFDYLADATVTLDDNIEATRTSRWEVIIDQFQSEENLEQKID